MRKFNINQFKIKEKLIVIYILCVFIPIVITNIAFYFVTTSHVIDQKKADAEKALTQLHNELKIVIDDAAGISYLYYIDSVLNKHLNMEYETYDQYVESLNSIKNIFNRSDKEYKTISSVLIMTDNPTILSSGQIVPLEKKFTETEWYKELKEHSSSYPYLYVTGNSISIIQELNYNLNNARYEHIIKIDLNMTYIKQLFSLSSFEGNMYFIGPDQKVHYTNDSSLIVGLQPVELEAIVMPEKSILMDEDYTSSRYLAGWSIHGVMNEAAVLKEVRQSGSFIVYLAIVNFGFATIVIYMVSKSIHLRIKNILKHMKKFRGKNFEKIPLDSTRDEIGELSIEFNRMIERIDNLINDVYVADIQKKELEIRQRQAQLHALHSQINPHFLFNALETIRMRSLMKGETETARTIQNMAKIFRKSISWKSSFVTIREEIELIESFLEIQKYRFGDKLQYQITVENSLYDQLIPKMTFLPFVENASIHGIENTPGIGLITLQIAQEQQNIIFVISDNGMGMSEEKLAALQFYMTDDEQMGDNVGMKNVYSRLKICYGEAFSYDIQSEPEQGTRIVLKLPIGETKP